MRWKVECEMLINAVDNGAETGKPDLFTAYRKLCYCMYNGKYIQR